VAFIGSPQDCLRRPCRPRCQGERCLFRDAQGGLARIIDSEAKPLRKSKPVWGASGCADQRFEQADQCRSTIPRASQAAASTMAGPVTMTRVSLCSWLMLSASMRQAWVMAVVVQNRRGTRSAASVDGYSLELWSKPGMGSSSPPSPARPRKTMRSFTPAYLRTNRSSARMMAEESSSLSPAPISAFICWAMSAAPGRGVAVSCALSMTMAMSLWCSLTLNPGL